LEDFKHVSYLESILEHICHMSPSNIVVWVCSERKSGCGWSWV